MAQITINVGTVANDGTGDTLRGAFSNTNSNFTELYSHNTNVVSNLVSVAVGTNAWSNSVGTAGNNYTDSVGVAGNNYTIQVGAASNTWSNTVGTAGNNYTNAVGVAGNNYTNAVGVAGNNYTNAVGVAGNNYTDAVGAAGNSWVNSTFTTISNGASAFGHANAAFDAANNSLQNTTIFLNGTYNDSIGSLRSKYVISSNDVNNNFILFS